MKRHIVHQSTSKHQLDFDEVYKQVTHAWEVKAERLQQRRWAHIKHAHEHSLERQH